MRLTLIQLCLPLSVHISRVPHAVNKFQVSYTYDSSAETKPSAMGRMQRRHFGAVIRGSNQAAL